MFFPIKNNLDVTITVGWKKDRVTEYGKNTIAPNEMVHIDSSNQFLILLVPPNTNFKLYPYKKPSGEIIAFIFYQILPNHADFDGQDVHVYMIDENNTTISSDDFLVNTDDDGGVGDPDDDLPFDRSL